MKILEAAASGFLLTVSIWIAAPSFASAQASAGPITPPPGTTLPRSPKPAAKPKPAAMQPRTTLDGAWKYNADDSDDLKTKIQDSRGRNAHGSGGGKGGGGNGGGGNGGGYPGGGYPGGYPGGPFPGGPYPGGPYPPGGGYPGGGYPNGGGGRDTETDERLEQFLRPPVSMSLALKGPEVDLTDDHFNKIIFYTDGRQLPKKQKKEKDDTTIEASAHWDGKQLITDEKTPQGSKMSRTFELSPDGRQCFETVHVDRGKSKGELTVRFVFNVEAPSTQPEHESDPNVPVMKRKAESPAPGAAPGAQPDAQSSQPAPAQAPDPDQPVMRHRTDGSSSSQ